MSDTTIGKKTSRKALRWMLGVLALAMCGAVVAYVATRPPPPRHAPAIQARLELAAGDVLLDMGKGEEHAISGTALLANAKLSTGKGARALVRLPDGSTIFMRDGSAVKLAADSVELDKGEYWLDAPPTDRKAMVHNVGDATVTAADAGLSVKKTAGGTTVYVARGMAIVTSKGGRVEVNAGEQATVKRAAAPKVAALSFWDDWTGGMADYRSGNGIPGAGSGTLYGVDTGAPPGHQASRLELSRQVVKAVVRDGLAETDVDQTFFNPGQRDVEGWYWFTVPSRASVTGFSVETNGVLVKGEFTERHQASTQYTEAKATGHAPAILEWVDSHTYRARIYPVPAGGTRRVVLSYAELRPDTDGTLEYIYPMGSGDPVRIGEFSLSVDLGDAGRKMKIATLADARIEQGGKLVTMRRSGYTPRADFQLEAKLPDRPPPLRLARFKAGGDSADYVLARYTPEVDFSKVKQPRGDVVVVVDTSAAGDEASRQLKASTAEAILRALSDDDRFALVALDVKATVLHPAKGLAPASDQQISKALEALADHSSGGATDLSSLFDVSLARLHGTEQPAVVYVGDGIATSGDMSGERLVERLRRALGTSRARLFTVAVGMDSDTGLLSELARAGGGTMLRVDEAEETTSTALQLAAALKVPTITDLDIDLGAGLDDVFTSASGKVSRGSQVTVLARTHHDLPSKVKVKGRLGGRPFAKEYDIEKDKGVLTAFVPRLWAAEYVRRLLGQDTGADAERGRIVSLGMTYGLMTPYTSILALESEAAYSEMGIPRKHSKLRGVELTSLDARSERRLAAMLNAPPVSVTFGCDRFEPGSGDKEQAVAARPADQKESPQSGTRAKAAEEQAYPVAPETKPQAAAPLPAAAPRAADVPEPAPSVLSGPGKTAANEQGARPKKEAKLAPRRHYAPSHHASQAGTVSGGLGGFNARAPKGKSGALALLEKDKKAEGGGERNDEATDPLQVAKLEPDGMPVQLATCSDAAARPLAQRVLLWRKRLRTAKSASELIARYEAARRACELGNWRAERTFLELLEKHVDNEGAVGVVLGHFRARPEVEKFLAKLILRRSVDPRMVAAVERVLFGSPVSWDKAELELSAIADLDKRIEKLREYIARAPEDPNGGIRLVKLLVEAGHKDEALAIGRRLRDQGLMTPHIAEQLGDVLAGAGLADEAVRTYSGIVEFDPESIASRRLLGDIYLGHGWYDPAYRQYQTITEEAPDDALGWLRLADAAAGAGRVDEALRIERKVSSAQGNPGPTDPRRWARLWSAERLAGLLDSPPKPAAGQPAVDSKRRAASIKRKLKQLQLFSGPGTLVLLTWQQLDQNVLLVERLDGKDVGLGEVTDAARAGLSSTLLSTADAARAGFVARLRSEPGERPVALRRTDIAWNGKDFTVRVEKKKLPAGATEVGL